MLNNLIIIQVSIAHTMVSPPTPSAKANSKILTLPPELIEQTLILAASHGFPSAIAQLSCTCRYFHQLVYRSTDSHLWREVFLATFDDPRPVLGRINSARLGSVRNSKSVRTADVGFNWEREFIRRMDAARIMTIYGNAEEREDNIAVKSDHVKVRTNLSNYQNHIIYVSLRLCRIFLERSNLFSQCWILPTLFLLKMFITTLDHHLRFLLYSLPTYHLSCRMSSRLPALRGSLVSSATISHRS